MPDTDRRGAAAYYVTKMRQAWASCGYKQTTLMVHENDKAQVSALADVIKFERLLKLVEANDGTAIELAASRNAAKLPTYDAVADLEGDLEGVMDKRVAADVNAWLKAVSTHSKDASAYKRVSAMDELDDVAKAKAVIYSHLAAAAVRMADALIEEYYKTSPKKG